MAALCPAVCLYPGSHAFALSAATTSFTLDPSPHHSTSTLTPHPTCPSSHLSRFALSPPPWGSSGDAAKAFGGGADFIMMGGIFAGTEEAAGKTVERDGKKFKQFCTCLTYPNPSGAGR